MCSNYDIFLTRDCLAYSKIKPSVNQIETHPYFQRDSLVKFCQKHGICVTAHTPIGGAAANAEWFGTVSCLDDPLIQVTPRCNQAYLIYFCLLLLLFIVCLILLRVHNLCFLVLFFTFQELAQKYKKSAAQLVLRWGIQRNTVVIPKSSKVERLEENYQVFDFTISDEDMEKIKRIDRKYRTNQPARFWGIDLFA